MGTKQVKSSCSNHPLRPGRLLVPESIARPLWRIASILLISFVYFLKSSSTFYRSGTRFRDLPHSFGARAELLDRLLEAGDVNRLGQVDGEPGLEAVPEILLRAESTHGDPWQAALAAQL